MHEHLDDVAAPLYVDFLDACAFEFLGIKVWIYKGELIDDKQQK